MRSESVYSSKAKGHHRNNSAGENNHSLPHNTTQHTLFCCDTNSLSLPQPLSNLIIQIRTPVRIVEGVKERVTTPPPNNQEFIMDEEAEHYMEWGRTRLRVELKKRGLSPSGLKNELLARMQQYVSAQRSSAANSSHSASSPSSSTDQAASNTNDSSSASSIDEFDQHSAATQKRYFFKQNNSSPFFPSTLLCAHILNWHS